MLIIDDILLAPIKGIIWLGEKINQVVEREMYDEGRIKEQLMALQSRLELDEINEEEYKKQEKVLLARLETSRKREED